LRRRIANIWELTPETIRIYERKYDEQNNIYNFESIFTGPNPLANVLSKKIDRSNKALASSNWLVDISAKMKAAEEFKKLNAEELVKEFTATATVCEENIVVEVKTSTDDEEESSEQNRNLAF